MKALTDDDLHAIIDAEIGNSVGEMHDDDVVTSRELSLQRYLNKPVGDEQAGLSSVQSSDVSDVVEALHPQTLEPFISGDNVVEFAPEGEEDEEMADQATDYINYLFLKDNPGFDILYTWQKDAFLSKNGFVKVAWEEKETSKRSVHRLDLIGALELINSEDVEVLATSAYFGEEEIEFPDLNSITPEMQMFEYEIEIRRTETKGAIRVYNIPPEHAIVSSDAMSFDESRIKGHKERKTVSQLIQEGFDPKILEKIPDAETDNTTEYDVRSDEQGGDYIQKQTLDPAMREVWLTEVYINVDYDGDGIAELRRVVRAGDKIYKGEILINEEVDYCDMYDFTPIANPHQAFGRSIAELTIPIQDVKTSLLRQSLDSVYRMNNPKYMIDENKATIDTIDDLLSPVPGQPVRVDAIDAITPLATTPVAGDIYQMLEYQDRIRETRTPVTRQDQGVDPNILQNKTATEASIQANSSEVKRKLILRRFANSLSKVFKAMLRLTVQYQDKARVVRLRNKWVEVNPQHWNVDMDINTNVGLGTGTKDQQMMAVNDMFAMQMQLIEMQQAGVFGDKQIVDAKGLYNSMSRKAELAGLDTVDLYLTDPEPQEGDMEMEDRIRAEKEAAFEEGREAGIEEGMQQGAEQARDDVKIREQDIKAQVEREKMANDRQMNLDDNNTELAVENMRQQAPQPEASY